MFRSRAGGRRGANIVPNRDRCDNRQQIASIGRAAPRLAQTVPHTR
jgi:hypothetical protein